MWEKVRISKIFMVFRGNEVFTPVNARTYLFYFLEKPVGKAPKKTGKPGIAGEHYVDHITGAPEI